MDLSFVLPYILVCLALASECHNLDLGAFYVIFAVALAMVYFRDFFLGVILFIFARYIAMTTCAMQFNAQEGMRQMKANVWPEASPTLIMGDGGQLILAASARGVGGGGLGGLRAEDVPVGTGYPRRPVALGD